MHQSDHAQAMADRFRELVEGTGDSLSVEHYDELKLIIESGLDTVLYDVMEKIAAQLNKLSHDIQNNAEFFN
jgi:hypothetical protein